VSRLGNRTLVVGNRAAPIARGPPRPPAILRDHRRCWGERGHPRSWQHTRRRIYRRRIYDRSRPVSRPCRRPLGRPAKSESLGWPPRTAVAGPASPTGRRGGRLPSPLETTAPPRRRFVQRAEVTGMICAAKSSNKNKKKKEKSWPPLGWCRRSPATTGGFGRLRRPRPRAGLSRRSQVSVLSSPWLVALPRFFTTTTAGDTRAHRSCRGCPQQTPALVGGRRPARRGGAQGRCAPKRTPFFCRRAFPPSWLRGRRRLRQMAGFAAVRRINASACPCCCCASPPPLPLSAGEPGGGQGAGSRKSSWACRTADLISSPSSLSTILRFQPLSSRIGTRKKSLPVVTVGIISPTDRVPGTVVYRFCKQPPVPWRNRAPPQREKHDDLSPPPVPMTRLNAAPPPTPVDSYRRGRAALNDRAQVLLAGGGPASPRPGLFALHVPTTYFLHLFRINSAPIPISR